MLNTWGSSGKDSNVQAAQLIVICLFVVLIYWNWKRTIKEIMISTTTSSSSSNTGTKMSGTEPQSIVEAAEQGNKGEIEWFLQNGERVDAQGGRRGQTALHCAITNGHHECVEILLKNGANMLVRDKFGEMALHLAVEKKDLKSLELIFKTEERKKGPKRVLELLDAKDGLEEKDTLELAKDLKSESDEGKITDARIIQVLETWKKRALEDLEDNNSSESSTTTTKTMNPNQDNIKEEKKKETNNTIQHEKESKLTSTQTSASAASAASAASSEEEEQEESSSNSSKTEWLIIKYIDSDKNVGLQKINLQRKLSYLRDQLQLDGVNIPWDYFFIFRDTQTPITRKQEDKFKTKDCITLLPSSSPEPQHNIFLITIGKATERDKLFSI